MTELQALISGALCGLMMREATRDNGVLAIEVELCADVDGNHVPYFNIIGKNTGERVRVNVEVLP